MTDISQLQFDQLLDRLGKMTGSLGTIAKGFDDGSSSSTGSSSKKTKNNNSQKYKEYSDKFNRVVSDTSNSLKAFHGGIDGVVHELASFARGLAAGAVVSELIHYAHELSKTYQNLSDVGQTFNGSILGMQIAAANAQLPLEMFGQLLQKYSNSVAVLGPQRFADLGKSVRNNIQQFGMFGLTVEQVNDIVGEYTDTVRLSGHLQNINTANAAKSMSDLINETSGLAILTGRQRSEVLKNTMQNLQDANVRAKISMMSDQAAEKYMDVLGKTTAFLAAQPGEAGDALSKMLTQTVGGINAIFSEGAQTMIEGGFSQGVGAMQQFADKVNAGTVSVRDQANFINNFVDEGKKALPNIHFLAQTGNQQALEMEKIITSMKKMSEEDIKHAEEQARQQASMTRFVTSFEQIWFKISGNIRETLFKSLDSLSGGLDRYFDSPEFKKVSDQFSLLGSRMSEFFGKIFTPENLSRIGTAVANFASILFTAIGDVVEKFSSFFSHDDVNQKINEWVSSAIQSFETFSENAKTAADLLVKNLTRVDTFFSDLGGNWKKFKDELTLATEAIGLFVAGFAIFKTGKWFADLFKVPSINFASGTVYVNSGKVIDGNGPGGSGGTGGSNGRGTNGFNSIKSGGLIGFLEMLGLVAENIPGTLNKDGDELEKRYKDADATSFLDKKRIRDQYYGEVNKSSDDAANNWLIKNVPGMKWWNDNIAGGSKTNNITGPNGMMIGGIDAAQTSLSQAADALNKVTGPNGMMVGGMDTSQVTSQTQTIPQINWDEVIAAIKVQDPTNDPKTLQDILTELKKLNYDSANRHDDQSAQRAQIFNQTKDAAKKSIDQINTINEGIAAII